MTVVTELHDTMEADKVAFQARKVGTIRVVHGSAAHRASVGSLEHEVYCVIEKPTQLKL
jgi:hypothetical protein